MSSNKRPRIGRRELQELGISGDALPAKRISVPAIISSRPTVGQLSLPAFNTSTEAIPAGKEENGTQRREESKEVGALVPKPPQTRGVQRRAQESLVEFNVLFRSLPNEVKYMIFAIAIHSNCKETPALVVGLRSRENHPDEELYKVALRANSYRNTFTVTRKNLYTINQELKGAMPSAIWETIRNLEIKHEYMKEGRMGFYQAFSHGTEMVTSYYSPCAKCDYQTILLAKNVITLHLDFGNSYHCVMLLIARTCKIAVEHMELRRLELTVSNILTRGNEGWLEAVIEKINEATKETGRLLSVRSSERYSAGPYTAHFATDTWFWNSTLFCKSTGRRKRLQWVDDEAKKRDDAAAARRARYENRGATVDNPTDE